MELKTRCCTLCGPSASKRVKYPERLQTAPPVPEPESHCRMVTCSQCGIIFADPALPPEQLVALNAQESVADADLEDDLYASYAPLLDHACRLAIGRGCFLEIGGGRGFMLRYGVEHGFDSQVEVDPSPQAAAGFESPGEQARFIQAPFEQGLVPDESVSLACLFQVLGQVANPLAMTRDVWTALEPGGVAVGVVHNTRALSARLLGERSPIFGLANAHLFNGNNVYRLFKEAGFEHIEVHTFPNAYSAKHWMEMLPTPTSVKRRALRFLAESSLGKVKIRLHAGNIAVIARKAPPAYDRVNWYT